MRIEEAATQVEAEVAVETAFVAAQSPPHNRLKKEVPEYNEERAPPGLKKDKS